MIKFVIIVGNVVDGFRAIGPFHDVPQAKRFAEEFLLPIDHWVSMELNPPSLLSGKKED